jgi:hypothetical protein
MMLRKNSLYVFLMAIAIGAFAFGSFKEVQAVPSFARQTGMDCMACHTAFPELTPFGRTFKLTGYTISKSDKPYQFPPPVAAMFQGSFTHTNKSLPKDAVPQDIHANDNWTIPQQASLFYGGKILYKVGAFSQFTFDGIADNFFLDNTDIRFANTAKLGGKHLIYGVTFNNNPTVQDVWNSTPAWGFPWAASDAAPTPAAGAVIDGALGSQVGGLGLYAFWNNLIYAEVTLYRTARNGFTEPLSAGTDIDTFVDGIVPYWRVALQHQKGKHSFAFGTYGMVTHIFPEGETRGTTDVFTDIALDAQYQYISKNHIFSAQTTWIHEIQDWNGSFPLGGTAKRSTSLDTFRINFNYYYRFRYGTLAGTCAFFAITGTKDPVLYAPDPVDGSRTGSPDSNGFILQASYLPWERTRFTVQYTIYNKFNGAGTNYDGFGRNASDNNTLYLLAWIAF